MVPISLAWGALNVYQLPNGGHIWGREFQILPSGTMANAAGVLHGLIGLEAEMVDQRRCQVQPDKPLLIYGTRGTDTGVLRAYQDELADGFNAQAAQRQA
jgi:hypothetical protein